MREKSNKKKNNDDNDDEDHIAQNVINEQEQVKFLTRRLYIMQRLTFRTDKHWNTLKTIMDLSTFRSVCLHRVIEKIKHPN